MNQHHSYYQMDTRVFDQQLRPIPVCGVQLPGLLRREPGELLLVVASSISLAPLRAAGLAHSAAPPLRGGPTALGSAAIHRREVPLLRKRGPGCPADPGRPGAHPQGVRLPGEPLRPPAADQQHLPRPASARLLRERGAQVRGAPGAAPVRPLYAPVWAATKGGGILTRPGRPTAFWPVFETVSADERRSRRKSCRSFGGRTVTPARGAGRGRA